MDYFIFLVANLVILLEDANKNEYFLLKSSKQKKVAQSSNPKL